MKVTYLINELNRYGGVERIVTAKANALADLYNYDVSISFIYHFDDPFFKNKKK